MPSKSSKSQPKTTVKSTFQLKSNAKKSVPRPALGVIRNRQIVLSDEEDEEDQDDSQSEDEEDELEPEGDRDEDDDKEDVEEENVSVGKKRSRRALKKINETGKGRKKRRLRQKWFVSQVPHRIYALLMMVLQARPYPCNNRCPVHNHWAFPLSPIRSFSRDKAHDSVWA